MVNKSCLLTCQFERLWMMFRPIWRKLPADTTLDLNLDWLSLSHSLQCWPNNEKCCNQMHFESIRYSKMRLRSGLRPGPRWESLQRLPEPMGALHGKPRGLGPTQNFGWVGHNPFGPASNWPVYSLILFVNLLKFVPPDVRFKAKMQCTKFAFHWGSAPDSAWGAYSAPPDP